MNSKNDAFIYAQDIINKRKANDYARFDEHCKFLARKYPEAMVVFEELRATQNRLLSAVFSNKEDLPKIKYQYEQLSDKLKSMLVGNNFDADYLDVKYTCDKCCDTGIYEGRNCECLISLMNEYNFKSLCNTSKIGEYTFNNFSLKYYPEAENEMGVSPKRKMSEILDYCKDYAETFSNKSRSVLMFGKTGLGKTHLSMAIATAVVKKGFFVVYGSAQNLLREAEKEYFSGGDSTINTLINCDLLILDDLGTEFDSKFNTSQIYNIINTRLEFLRPTIINTNLSGKELQERYAPRVVSRLIGEYDCLNFLGNDIRQLKNKE